jgi:hypothetical protein
MPHVHADLHEMGYNNNYYFAPAAEPYHKFITDYQRKFQTDIGKNHAKYFDEKGWLYFTREIFDLFYPSYGDTYPTFNGAIGMTYEKAGHGMAGRAILLENGDTLTLQRRIDEHATAALSTVEICSKNANIIIANYKNYFKDAISNPRGKYLTYVLKSSPKLKRLSQLLDRNKIYYAYANENKSVKGFNYFTYKDEPFSIEPGDMIVQAKQAKSILAQVLFEPHAELSDSVTYDITAWALPYAYGVQTYGSTSSISVNTVKDKNLLNHACTSKPYAYIVPWESIESGQILSKLMQANVNVRMAKKNIQFDDVVIAKGSLVVNRGDNLKNSSFDKTVK